MDDAPVLAALCNNKKVWDNVRDYLPHPYKEEDAVNFIEKLKGESPQQTFAIEFEDQLVGCIGIHPQDDVYRLSAEIGYWIGEPYWGKGFATEAITGVIAYGFGELELIRIYAGCFDFNIPSQKVLLKAGFHEESVSEKAIIKNGVICNEIRYALIKSPD